MNVKFSIAFLIFIYALSGMSCSSGRVTVPGESKVIERNINQEYFSIAEIYKSSKNYEKAIEYYEKVLGTKEHHEVAFYQIALCNVYLGKWAEARKSFIRLLKKDRENISLKSSLAYIEAMNGNFKKAERMYENIYSQNPNDSDVLVNLINVLIERKKYAYAKERLVLLEDKFPDDSHINDLKTKLSELTEDLSDAKSELESDSVDDGDISEEKLFGTDDESVIQ